MISYREFRRQRDRAGLLASLVVRASRRGYKRDAWSIFHKWLDHKITYREAKKRLEELAGKSRGTR